MRFANVLLGIATLLPLAAASKPFAAWAVDPADATGAVIEIHAGSRRGDSDEWRLVARGGEVLHVMRQPSLPAGHVVNHGDCRHQGRWRDDLIAIVRLEPSREWSGEVHAVWIVDARRAQFVPVPRAGWTCRNEGYGV